MMDKIKKAIKKSRKYFIIFGVLWFLLTIVFVLPIACTIVESTSNGKFVMEAFIEQLGPSITNIFGNLGKVFTENYTATFFGILGKFTFIYLILMVIGILRLAPKHEYSDIEHGSSDWSENGEQYRELSKKEGIILAEDNYLPLDKRGNINVMIVGRIWIW